MCAVERTVQRSPRTCITLARTVAYTSTRLATEGNTTTRELPQHGTRHLVPLGPAHHLQLYSPSAAGSGRQTKAATNNPWSRFIADTQTLEITQTAGTEHRHVTVVVVPTKLLDNLTRSLDPAPRWRWTALHLVFLRYGGGGRVGGAGVRDTVAVIRYVLHACRCPLLTAYLFLYRLLNSQSSATYIPIYTRLPHIHGVVT